MSDTDLQPTVSLSQDQIEFFHLNGFLAIDAITTPDEVAWLRGIYDRIFRERAGRDVGDQFDLAGADEDGQEEALPQILGPVRYAPELAGGLFRVNGLHLCRQLLGPECTARGEHAILKPARFGAETPWHQDEAYWNPKMDYTSLSVWIPLQDATLENGCMWFIPGSHRWEVQPHHSIHHDPRVHGLEVDELDTSTAVPCPIPAGGATFHLSRTFHYAGLNRTTEPRRAYILGFGLDPAPRAEPRVFYWNDLKQTPREARRAASAALRQDPGV